MESGGTGTYTSSCGQFRLFSLVNVDFFTQNRGEWILETRVSVTPRSLCPIFLNLLMRTIEIDHMMKILPAFFVPDPLPFIRIPGVILKALIQLYV